MKKSLLILALLFPLGLQAQTQKLSAFSQKYLTAAQDARSTSPVARARAKALGFSATAKEANRMVATFIHLDANDPEGAAEKLRAEGVQIGTVAAGIATARIPLSQIAHVAQRPEVKYLEVAAPVRTKMDKARAAANVDAVQSGTGLELPYGGKDVVVGIIDNGFEYGHVNFWTADRTALRVKRVWNQTSTLVGTHPANFSYGVEYNTQEAILAAERDTTTSTHATHVAGVAAGSTTSADGSTNLAGAAPEADLVLVSLDEERMGTDYTALIIDGIKYIYDYAESVGKPAVVNISLGTHWGPHDGTSAFDQMADALQGKGRLLVGSVGNEGADAFHLSKKFSSTEADTLRSFPTFYYSGYQFADFEIWGEKEKTFSYIPIVYDINGQQVALKYEEVSVGPKEQEQWEYEFTLDNDHIIGKMMVQTEIDPTNGKPHMIASMYFYEADGYRPGFFLTSPDDNEVHIWTDDIYSKLSSFSVPGFEDGNSQCSAGEIGGTGKRIISVGAYTTRAERFNWGIRYPSTYGKLNDICNFSSMGPTADGRLKPEVTAPGAYLLSSVSSYYTGSKSRETSIQWNGKKYEIGYMAGTSMAAPFVAGVLATWLQARPEMTPEEVRSILAKTGTSDSFTGTVGAANMTWGYGKINALAGIKEALTMPTAIRDTETLDGLTLLKTEYIGLDGRRMSQPTAGRLVLVKKTYKNGRIQTEKKIY